MSEVKYNEEQFRKYIDYLLSFKQMLIVGSASALYDDIHESMTEYEIKEILECFELEQEEVQSVNVEKVKTFEEFVNREKNLSILLDD